MMVSGPAEMQSKKQNIQRAREHEVDEKSSPASMSIMYCRSSESVDAYKGLTSTARPIPEKKGRWDRGILRKRLKSSTYG